MPPVAGLDKMANSASHGGQVIDLTDGVQTADDIASEADQTIVMPAQEGQNAAHR
jgi:regulator of extracellular matrix RemA (YlzA/DUF370 family)